MRGWGEIPDPFLSGGKMNENDIQKFVVKHFRVLEEKCGGFTMFAVAGGSVRVPVHIGKKLKSHGVRAGVHDLIFLLAGGATVMIELKTLTGSMTDAQKAFHGIVNKLGGFGCYSIKVENGIQAVNQISAILKTHGLWS